MKIYEVHYVERGGMPGVPMASFEGVSDKAAKEITEACCYFNRSANTGHCGIRLFRMDENLANGRKCIFKKFWHA
jgi:hypothetical protein